MIFWKYFIGIVITISVIFFITTDTGQVLDNYFNQNINLFLLLSFIFLLGSNIFAPMSGFLIYITIVRYVGLDLGILFLFFSLTLSSIINFFIAKIFGRNLINKFLTKKQSSLLSDFSDNRRFLSIFLSRVFGYYYHDIFSYLWGLMPVKFFSYFIASFLGTIIPIVIQYLIFKNLDTNSFFNLIAFYSGMIFLGAFFFFIWNRVKKKEF